MTHTPQRVLVPIATPEVSREALAEAARHVELPCDLHVLHVLPGIEQDQAIGWGTIGGESREDYALRDLRQRLQGTAFDCARLAVAFGDPATEIVEAARRLGVDLIVMDAPHRGGLARLVSRSVTEQVLQRAPCRVLVVPSGPEPEPV